MSDTLILDLVITAYAFALISAVAARLAQSGGYVPTWRTRLVCLGAAVAWPLTGLVALVWLLLNVDPEIANAGREVAGDDTESEVA